MKKVFIFTLLFLSSTLYAAESLDHANLFLTVSNAWSGLIKLKEGWIYKKEREIYPNGSITWQMMTSSIDNLEIKYFKNGFWQYIPGCPSGTFRTSLTIIVGPSTWDSGTPVCFIK